MSLLPASPLPPAGIEGLKSEAARTRLRKSAQQFEAVFVGRLLDQMHKSTLASGMFGKGVENDIYQGFLDQAVAEKVASRGGMGIAAMLEKTLAGKITAAGRPVAAGEASSEVASPGAPCTRDPFGSRVHGARGPAPSIAPVGARDAPAGASSARDVVSGTSAALSDPRVPTALGSLGAGVEMELDASMRTPTSLGSLAAEVELGLDGDVAGGGPSCAAAGAARDWTLNEKASGRSGSAPAATSAASARGSVRGSHGALPGQLGARIAPSLNSAGLSPALAQLVNRAARESGVDPRLLDAVLMTESGGRVRAVSPKGALGLMQLMPDTARAMGVKNVFDPLQNLQGGARYLSQLLHRFGGSVKHAVAAYNAGPTAVERHGGVPPFQETRAYVQRVLARRDALAAGGSAPRSAAGRME